MIQMDERMDVTAFMRLFEEFAHGFVPRPEVQGHIESYAPEREHVKQAFPLKCERADRGEGVTDIVLSNLLPHSECERNKQRGD